MMESSYIIGFYTAPTTCYLKNGTTGDITTTGTFYYCLQAAVNYLTTGGKISIRSGAYDLIAGIVIETNNIWIQGEDEALSTTIRYNATGGLGAINYVGSLGWHYLGGISNIWFHGELQNNIYGLVVVGQYSDLVFKDCLFTNFDSAVVLYGGPASLGKIWNIWFTRCLFEDNLRAAINITHTLHATLASIDRIKISECHFYDNLNSIYCDAQYVWHVTLTDNTVQSERNACINITSGGRQWIVTDNHIFDCGIGANGTMAAIMVNGTGTLYPDSWLIENNIIANHFTSAPVALNNSVWLTGTVRNFAIQNNYFYVASEGVRLSGLSLTLDPQLIIKGNVGNPSVTTTSWNMGFGAEPYPATYLIYSSGSYYYMKNGTTGTIDYFSTDAPSVINSAIGNLSGSMTVTQKITFKGTFSIGTTILLNKPFTYLDCTEATFILTANTVLLDVHSTVSPYNLNCTIDGGHFIGRAAGSSVAIRFFYAMNCTLRNANIEQFVGTQSVLCGQDTGHISILNCWIHDNGVAAPCIQFSVNSEYNMVANCRLGNSGDGVLVDSTAGHHIITGCEFYGWTFSGSGHHGIYLDGAAPALQGQEGNIISNCIFHDWTMGAAIFIKTDHNIVSGCHFYSATGSGTAISIYSEGTGARANYNQITGCTFDNIGYNAQYCILIGNSGATDNTVGNHISGCTFSNTKGGFEIQGTASSWTNDTVIENNNFLNCSYYGIVFDNAYIGRTIIQNNVFKNCTTPVKDPTTAINTLVRWNIGYITEASGNTASCINGTVIPHRMIVAPVVITLAMSGQPYMNSTCWILTPTILAQNATHFVIALLVFNAGTITPVAAVNARTIYWQCQTWNFP
jgi:hypothetical protein